jgi:glycosyltransferase 2 family protein
MAATEAVAALPRVERRWRPHLLAVAEHGRRNRRTIDGVLLAGGAIVLGLAAAVASAAKTQDDQVAQALVTVFSWADGFWRAAFVSAAALALLVVVDGLYRRWWALVRDIALALVVEIGLGLLLGAAVISDWLPVKSDLLARWGFPELRLAGITAILVVSGPELVRPARHLALALVLLAAVGAVAIGAADPSAALAGVAFGLGGAAAVRLAFGTVAGVPPTARIREELAVLGLQTADLQPAEHQHVGSSVYVGHDETGRPLTVRVLGRDAQDTQRLARRWRSLAYRDPRHSVAVGRVEQVEHEALATLMAGSAGVHVPEVVTAALSSYGDALLVTHQPDLAPLEEAGDASDALLRALWKEVALLHGAGISHGRLNLRNVTVVNRKPVLIDLGAATIAAPQTALDIDVAELLVSSTVLVGPERALAAALDGIGGDAITRALPYLERAALTPHTRELARRHDVALKQLRESAATGCGVSLPELAVVRRVRARDFLATGLIALAAYLLITKLAKIGFGTIYHELKGSDPVWVAVAIILAQVTYVSQAFALRGAVETPLPLLPVVVLKSAAKFLNLTVPGSAGSIALNIRFLQKLGAPTGAAVASGAIDGITATVVEILLVLAVVPFVNLNLNTKQISGAVPSGTFIAIIFAALILAVAIVLLVPSLHRRVVPSIRTALTSLWVIARSGRKLGELFGASLATELVYALTLGAAALAYGVHLSLAELIAVNVVASTLAGLVPVPGGIGAAEAALAGGLVALGVPESVAFAIALTDRICTYYLPPIPGYFSLDWLRRKGFV